MVMKVSCFAEKSISLTTFTVRTVWTNKEGILLLLLIYIPPLISETINYPHKVGKRYKSYMHCPTERYIEWTTISKSDVRQSKYSELSITIDWPWKNLSIFCLKVRKQDIMKQYKHCLPCKFLNWNEVVISIKISLW